MSITTLTMAIIIAILLVAVVFILAILRTQSEDALFEHEIDITKLTEVNTKYTELRHFEASQLMLFRQLQDQFNTATNEYIVTLEQITQEYAVELESVKDELAAANETLAMRNF